MKRTLIIAAVIIVLLGLGVLLYIFFQPSAKLTVGNNFGDTGAGNANSQGTLEAGTGSGTAGTVVAPNLIEITTVPVSAGEAVFDIAPSSSGTTTNSSSTQSQTFTPGDVGVHYIDRASGNVYEYLALTRKLSRVSDKTLPGIQEASWLPDGSMALVRFLSQTNGTSQIDTYALPYDGNGGYFLQGDLAQAIVTGANTIFTLTTSDTSSVGSTANSDGTNINTLFNSPLTSILIHPAGTGFIAANKAASEIDGYAFFLSSGKFTPILGPLRGLTVLPSPDGKSLLYSYTDGTTLHMSALNMTSGTVTNLPLATLAEKCVWTPDSTALYCGIPDSFSGNLPDDWYQGTVSFTDRIWRIDLTTRLATLVVDPSTAGNVDIDAVNLAIDPSSQVLVFRNKKDSSLWAYTLNTN